MQGYHRSVLLKEGIEALEVKKGRWYLDATLGDGGYTLEILRLGGKVVGIDVDPEALERTRKRFESLGIDKVKYRFIQGNFRDLDNLEQTETKFAGAIFDLGVSSLQLETPERGFSFGKDGPLDMRMDPKLQVKARDLVNALSRKELNELFSKLGEEKYSWRLADALVLTREVERIGSTTELARIVERVVGRKNERIHPATRVFQALRIAVNDELNALKEGLDKTKEIVEKNGRIMVVSFHSLEDRIVKFTFRKWVERGIGEILTGKPIVPSEQEVKDNPRSRSAKLRIFKIL